MQFASTGASPWDIVGSPRTTSPRMRALRALAIVVVLSVVVFVVTAYFTTTNKAQALIGHPEVLREGCVWNAPGSGTFVQNCKVWSPSQNKWVIVQIRASNDSTRGVYFLDGMRAREDKSAWTTEVQASKIYDRSTNTTLVMPVGGASSFYTDWNGGAGDKNTTIKQETFLTSELPGYLEKEFGVARSNNAIVGLSMSAGPAVTLAEKHPEQFKVVQAMSGYYQTDNPLGALGVLATQTMVSNYTNGIVNMWGPPGSAQWTQNDASKNLSKLKENGQVLVVSTGNAMLSPAEMARMAPQDQISAILLEALAAVSTVLFQLQAQQQGVSVVSIPNYGGHNWQNWGRALTGGRTAVLDALRATPPVTDKTTVLRAAQIGETSTSSASSTTSTTTTTTRSSAPAASASDEGTDPVTTTTTPTTTGASGSPSPSVSVEVSGSVPSSSEAYSDEDETEGTEKSADPSDKLVTTTSSAR